LSLAIWHPSNPDGFAGATYELRHGLLQVYAIGGKTEGPIQPSETTDPVLKKAKITVAAKMENPASAEFVDMKRAMRENTFGQPFEVICGHVKGKKKSGEATGERPFLYLVKEDEAFIVGSNPDSMAAIAYRAHCTSPNPH
jgi:hypothetical protein